MRSGKRLEIEAMRDGFNRQSDSRMCPLEEYVNSRMQAAVLRRIGWQRVARSLPKPLGDFIHGKIWRWPYRHMRSYPWHMGRLEPDLPGTWRISVDDIPVATTVPLTEWAGPIERPVTIVAGGPSAREHDFAELACSGRMIVAVNGVPELLAGHGIRPDAWIVADLRLAEMIRANFSHARGTPLAIPGAVAAILAEDAPAELASRPVCVIERVNQWHGVRSLDSGRLRDLNKRSASPFVFPPAGDGKSVVGWSHRPEFGFFSGCTVAFAALQIMVGLGARDIEIIGMDLSGTGHAYPDKEGSIPSSLDADYECRILPSFGLMSEALRGSGVRVRNLSPVCRLPRDFFAE